MAKKLNYGKLKELCKILHPLMYERHDQTAARVILSDLETLLSQFSPDDGAIVTAEAFAIFHELREEYNLALTNRHREVELMNKLYDDIRINSYSAETKDSILKEYGLHALAVRERIIHSLEQRCKGSDLPE